MARRLVRWLLLNAAVALVYAVLGKAGLALALPPGYVSALWPAAGMAFAVALVWGSSQVVVGVFLGSLLINSMTGDVFNPSSHLSLNVSLVSVGLAAGSAIQCFVGSTWLRRSNPELRFDSPSRVLRFSLIGLVSCLIAASIGNLSLYLLGVISREQVPQSFLTWWLGDAFGVQIFAPLTLLVLAPNATWARRRLSVGAPLLLAFMLCGLIYYLVRDASERQLVQHVSSSAEPVLNEMRAINGLHGLALQHLAAVYQLSDQEPGQDFIALAADLHRAIPGFRAIEWAPVLMPGEHAARAAEARAKGQQPLTVTYPAGFAPADDQRRAPISMVIPLAGNERVLGVDLLGEPTRAAAVDAALRSGALAVSRPVPLTQDPTGPGGLLLMAPVQNKKVRGVIVGVLDLRLLEHNVSRLPGMVWEMRERRDQGLPDSSAERSPSNALNESALRADHDALVIARSSATVLPRFNGDTLLDRSGVSVQQGVRLADREWTLVLHVPHARLVHEAGNASLLVLFLSLAACGVFANFVLILSGDRDRVANEVREKTLALQAEMNERQRIDDALRDSQNLLANVVENSATLIFVKDRFGVYQLVNSLWERTAGLKREEVLGKTDDQLFPPERARRTRSFDNEVMETGSVQQREEVQEREGRQCYYLTIKFPLKNHAGEVTGLCGMTTDITERKQYELALEESKRAAEAANIAKSQFLATMSHEIRTPMNGILGMAQLLMMGDLDEAEHKEFVRTILNSGQSLMTILNDILDLSKIESGKLELNVRPFDPVALCEEVAALFRESAQQKGLTLSLQVPHNSQRYLGDALRLRQMLSNLVSNAIKFSDRGDIRVCLEENDGALEFAVIDQGIGIPAQKLPELFAPFVQVDGSATRRFGGTGLGLSIVRRLAQLMGGDVGVESREAAGSRFSFHIRVLPVPDAQDEHATRQTARTGSAGTVANVESAGDKVDWVLVVEDIPVNQAVVVNLLDKLGMPSRCAEHGEAALALLATHAANPPCLILMDCQMPVLDGYATTQIIRQREAEGHLPRQRIVALTASAFADDRQRCLDAGMDDYLAKPLLFDDLRAAVQRSLARTDFATRG